MGPTSKTRTVYGIPRCVVQPKPSSTKDPVRPTLSESIPAGLTPTNSSVCELSMSARSGVKAGGHVTAAESQNRLCSNRRDNAKSKDPQGCLGVATALLLPAHWRRHHEDRCERQEDCGHRQVLGFDQLARAPHGRSYPLLPALQAGQGHVMLRPVSAGQRAHVAHERGPGQGVGVPTEPTGPSRPAHQSGAHGRPARRTWWCPLADGATRALGTPAAACQQDAEAGMGCGVQP
jgi:hypothetical protein